MPAAQNLRLGPSFPSTTIMPAPNRWGKAYRKYGPVNEAADGTAYFHQMGAKNEWRGEWEEISLTDANLIITEYNRTRSLALIDFDQTSWTVIAAPGSLELEYAPGTNPPLYNLRIQFREK